VFTVEGVSDRETEAVLELFWIRNWVKEMKWGTMGILPGII